MDDLADRRFPRLAPALLLGVVAWIAIIGDEAIPAGQRLTELAAVAVVGYVAWRFHGLPAAGAAILLLHLIDPAAPPQAAANERWPDVVFLATLGLGVAAGSRQGRAGPIPWGVMAVVGAAVAFGWYRMDAWPTADPVARDRLRHITLGIAVLSVLTGLAGRRASWRDRLKLLAAALGPPAAGLVAFRLAQGDWPRTPDGADWPALVGEWRAAAQNGDWRAGAWCWAAPWLSVPLLAVGTWRAVARGRKQLKAGEGPLAWLVAVAGLGCLAALGTRPAAAGSLALGAVGVLLSVFGVADLVLALVERIELRPPDPGPSNVPRVK